MVDGAEGWGAEEGVDGKGLRGWGGVGREGAFWDLERSGSLSA